MGSVDGEARVQVDPGGEEARAQLERILRSDSFHNSDSLRRLLGYLAEKSLSEQGDQLKEYAIGVDVFGKSQDYDPRLDSGVRLQVSRLRQKLAEYYAAEGAKDEVVVTLPKGRFKLAFEHRMPVSLTQPDASSSPAPGGASAKPVEARRRRLELVLAGTLVAAVVWASASTYALRRAKLSAVSDPKWSEAMEMLWRPFVQTDRPLVISLGTPLFVGVQGCCFFHDGAYDTWEAALQDPRFKVVRKALNNPDLFAARIFTTAGQAQAVLQVGTLLARRLHSIQFARSSDLSWRQLSDGNAIFVGNVRNFGDLMSSLPVKAEIVLAPGGIRVLHPGNGEAGFVPDVGSTGFVSSPDDKDAHAGEIHAVISVLPGPNGRGFVGSFLSNNSGGSLAAVEYATNPASVAELLGRLKDGNGRVPKYFQVALKVGLKGGLPTSSRFLLKREVQLEQGVTELKGPNK